MSDDNQQDPNQQGQRQQNQQDPHQQGQGSQELLGGVRQEAQQQADQAIDQSAQRFLVASSTLNKPRMRHPVLLGTWKVRLRSV